MARFDLTRPCEVRGQPCRFHKFVRKDRLVLKTELFIREEDVERAARALEERGLVTRGFTAMNIQTTAALIEWPDGKVTLEPADAVRFTDAADNNVGGKADEWIPVERELPTPFVSVLVYVPTDRPLPTVREGYMAADGTWVSSIHLDKSADVVAWRHMPEPPERVEVLE